MPGEATEIAREMGLVCITASGCQLRPSHIAALVQRPKRTLKASNPAPLFRRKTNILAEDSVQPPLADAQRACRFVNAKRPKQVQRAANMARRSRAEARSQSISSRICNVISGVVARSRKRSRQASMGHRSPSETDCSKKSSARSRNQGPRPPGRNTTPASLFISPVATNSADVRAPTSKAGATGYITLRTAIRQMIRRERDNELNLAPRQHQLALVQLHQARKHTKASPRIQPKPAMVCAPGKSCLSGAISCGGNKSSNAFTPPVIQSEGKRDPSSSTLSKPPTPGGFYNPKPSTLSHPLSLQHRRPYLNQLRQNIPQLHTLPIPLPERKIHLPVQLINLLIHPHRL